MVLRATAVFVFGTAILWGTLPVGAQPGEPAIFRAPLRELTPSKRGVVFRVPLAREFGRQCSRVSPVGWWTTVAPSKVEIGRLERALPAWMKTVKVQGWKGGARDYYFQYGAVVRGGKRFVYVNAVPVGTEDGKQLWRRGPEVVCDGGPNFWGVEFDVQSGRFLNAGFNGLA